MAPNVVSRIREKLSQRRHSFTESFKSARSTASSIRSGNGHHHDEHDPKQSRSNTPSQLASQVLDNDHDPDVSSSSSSASSTDTTTTVASHDHTEEKSRPGYDGADEREEERETPIQQQLQLRQTQRPCRKATTGGQDDGGGGVAKSDTEAEAPAGAGARGDGQTSSEASVKEMQAAEGTAAGAGAAAVTGATAGAATSASTEAPAEAADEAPRSTGPSTGPFTEDSGSGANAPAANDPPHCHLLPLQQPLSQTRPSPSTSSPPSFSSFSLASPSSANNTPPPPTATPCTTSPPTTTPTTTIAASSLKPIPPPLVRQNSWQYRKSVAQQLQSIDEDYSDPPSPTTVTPPTSSERRKSTLADNSVTATSDDSYNSSSSNSDGAAADYHDEIADDEREYDDIDKRLARVQELRRAKRIKAPSPRANKADKQLTVTATEAAPAPRVPQTETETQLQTQSQDQVQVLARIPILPTQVSTTGSIAAADGKRAAKLLQAAAAAPRKQSLFDNRHSHLIKTLLDSNGLTDDGEYDPSCVVPILEEIVAMSTRKIWVKRPGASATLVTIKEGDLVDDVRDTILTKYGNSLGKTFDSPDLGLRIVPREGSSQKERLLGPEEPMCRTLDTYFPGTQAVSEALLIVVDTPPPRRQPRPSPRAHGLYPMESAQPPENGEGYFPPVPGGGMPSPHRGIVLQPPPPTNNVAAAGPTHSIAVLSTGQIPNIPSPGGSRPRFTNRDQSNRPKLNRTHTQSPTVVAGSSHTASAKPSTAADTAAAAAGAAAHSRPSHSRAQSNSSEHQRAPATTTNGAPLPGSPVTAVAQQARIATPPPRVTSPRTSAAKIRKIKKLTSEPLQPNTLNWSVPPISVLIVEDNPINLKLLEAFVKKLKVRWSTAMNGRDAVTKWRTGGFHLVLMDIQLPVMNGLDATREIRRLERVNSIGVFTSSSSTRGTSSEDGEEDSSIKDQDKLEDMSQFKSPVIIVALTASSLQSDRHEALAAGCNDFLTKPVNFVWLERKIMEWGCMQALIDFDGWRKWKDFSEAQAKEASAKAVTRTRTKKFRPSASNSATISAES